jgi:hypothetical protein
MNFKNHCYPTNTNVLIEDCLQIAKEFDRQLQDDVTEKILLSDIYKMKGSKCTANRNALRDLFECNSTNSKYHKKEIKGVYMLVDDSSGSPYYVGISQTIIRRLKQHVFGKSHNHATLTYLMARHDYEQLEGRPHKGTRMDLSYFNTHRERIQEKLRTSRVMIKEINNNFLMHAVEVHLACHYKTRWNCFETH